MTRGIQLKRLKNTDLTLLGLSDASFAEEAPAPHGQPSMLAEADPVLSEIIGDVVAGLVGTLDLLDEALAAVAGADATDPDRRIR